MKNPILVSQLSGEQVEVDWADDPAIITDQDTGEIMLISWGRITIAGTITCVSLWEKDAS